MEAILSRLRNNDESVKALDLSTRDDLEFQFIFPEGTMPDSQNIPEEWRTSLAKNSHVRELCLFASFLDTVDQEPARHSRFAVLMELFSHLQSLEELEVHAFSVPTRIFPVIPLANLLSRQVKSLRKLALYNIRSEGIISHTEGFRWQLAQAISLMECLEELVWEPFPLESSFDRPALTAEDEESQRVVDEALVSAIIGLPKLRRLSLCAKSVNMLIHPLERLPFSRRCLGPLWKQSKLDTVHLTGYSLTCDDLRVLLGISKRRPTPQRQLVELHLTQFSKILEYQNNSLHWAVTRSPSGCASIEDGGISRQQDEKHQRQKLDTLLHLNRSGLRDVSLRPELQFTCPRHMWPELLCKLGNSSPTAVSDILHRNFEALFIRRPSVSGVGQKEEH
eukprot:scaffold4097_cov166-Amphora_coffeaeformis.AAC.62